MFAPRARRIDGGEFYCAMGCVSSSGKLVRNETDGGLGRFHTR
jgi:hypothetical protein